MRALFAALLALAAAACASPPQTPIALSDPSRPALGPYAQAIEAGGFVFVSGIIAFDAEAGAFAPGEIGAQTRQTLDNLESLLAANRLTLADVVKVTVFLRSPADIAGMNAVYAERFAASPPARTLVPGADWGRDDILIEIDAIAVRR